MERSISSITFKGSISEAILEAKRQRKLFVVYTSGEDAESIRLEKSTWMDGNVEESLSKYCILLHILEGSTEAAHFSAIYPQKSVPCITVVGYNGVQLWQNEGFVSADILASSLEKAWLSLHIQETTATVLTAALASKKTDPSTSRASDIASSEEGSSSSSDVPSPSTHKHTQSSGARPLVTAEVIEENKGRERKVEEIDTELGDQSFSRSICANELESCEDEQSASSTETAKELLSPETVDPNNSRVGHNNSAGVEDGCPAPEENNNVLDCDSGISQRASQITTNESNEAVPDKKLEAVPDKKLEAVEDKKADALDYSNDVHLNIRFPNGASLQEKFSVTSTLRMVKDYVDSNQASDVGSYDLAIPYPRKVFDDQDLSKSLLDLGLLNRQALIVIPHQRALVYQKGGSSSRDQTNSTTATDSIIGSNGGYFAFAKRIVSYINPFSYLGGSVSSSSSGQESQNRMWQYDPDPTLRNNRTGTERPSTRYSPNQSTSEASRNDKSKQPTTSRFGSNIHTLKHDEDDDRFGDKNAFWNGNSTQYGGDNNGK
ncbi:hypothetical protein L1049_017475 [Liquidambar formosana]|uniref:UBX domain-containing protein n=1 Tax=Liquidambar formosana TaxID=63359 RepID=A0AAP0S3A5_LIQFO